MLNVLRAFLLLVASKRPQLGLIHFRCLPVLHNCKTSAKLDKILMKSNIFISWILLFYFPLCSGPPLFWVGVGVALSAVFSWVRIVTICCSLVHFYGLYVLFYSGKLHFMFCFSIWLQVATYVKVSSSPLQGTISVLSV